MEGGGGGTGGERGQRRRGRSLTRRAEEAKEEAQQRASKERRRTRSRSTPADKARTARSLSGPRSTCTPARAAHILDKHFHSGADNTGSYFYSAGELDRAVGRALASPDAVQDTGRTRQLRFKTFHRAIGRSNGYFGGDKACDAVAVVVEKGDGSVVTAYPLPSQHIPSHRSSHARLRPVDEPPSVLSHSLSDESLHPHISLLSDPSQSLSHDALHLPASAQPLTISTPGHVRSPTASSSQRTLTPSNSDSDDSDSDEPE